MSIRAKIMMFLLAAALAGVGYIYVFWIPKADNGARNAIIEVAKRELHIVSEMLVPLIIQDELAVIHQNLTELEAI